MNSAWTTGIRSRNEEERKKADQKTNKSIDRFLMPAPDTPARKIIDNGLPIALATDYNPGSTPSGNMNFVVATACIKMKMTPEEAINAATINGAFAMNVSNKVGSITKGKLANFIITKEIPSYGFIPYSFGANLIESVYIKGNKF